MDGARIREVRYTRKFLKALAKLPERVIIQASQKEEIFKNNPFDSRLGTHKLSGKEKEHWAFWINYSYRIKFLFISDSEVLFLGIGTHEIYK